MSWLKEEVGCFKNRGAFFNENLFSLFCRLMQGLAKQSRHIMFRAEDIVSFGNYLFRTYNVQVYSSDGKNTPISLREVTHADFENWPSENPDRHSWLPSRHKIGQPVWLRLWSHDIIATVLCVHFYEGKVKYDLELLGDNGDKTRIYNVDSMYVVDKLPDSEGRKG